MSISRIRCMLIAALLLACAGQTLAQTVAAQGDEPKLIAVVKDSGAPLKARIDACRQLAIVGGKDSIGPLAALLGDEQLSHNARYALQTNPDPAVDEALRAALGKVKGRPLVGVIHTVGYRRDAQAVGALARLLTDSSPMVTGAAARALGSVGNAEAIEALQQALPNTSAECKLDLYEGLLRGAESLAADGKRQAATRIYDRLARSDAPHQVRGGALRAAILTRQPAGRQKQLQAHLGDEDYILFSAAVEASHQMRSPKVTAILTGALKDLPADREILVIQALGTRSEKGATSALLEAAKAGEPRVRVAALAAATELGDPSAVPALVQLLDDPDAAISKAALDSLATFPDSAADEAVMEMFAGDDAARQRLALDLMGRRRMTGGLPDLVKAARDANPTVRSNAIKMIGDLGGPAQLPVMFGLLRNAGEAQELAAVEQAITAICLRTADPKAQADKVIAELDKVGTAQKASLVRVLGAVGGPNAMQAVCASARSDDADVRSAAVRALGTWKTVDAAPMLLVMAKETSNPAERTLFLRGYLNLAARGDVPIEDRLAMCRQAAGMIDRADEKRLLLGTLGRIESREAVELIVPYVDDEASRQEAVLAAVTVSERLLRGRVPASFAAMLIPHLEKVEQAAGDGSLASRAKGVLDKARTQAKGQ